ncbi:MAG: ComF family protein [Polyangiales bacterium]
MVVRLVDVLLSVLAPPRCAACDERLARDAAFCGACMITLEPPPHLPPGTTASFAFGGAIAEAVRRYKLGPRADLARPLGRAIVERLPAPSAVDVVVPVPLHPRRLRARGFDQATHLARAVARSLGRPLVLDRLTRVADTPQLARLDAAARQRAVASAFRARDCTGARVLLVDAVRTTGATLDAASRAVATVGGLPLAHVLAATARE